MKNLSIADTGYEVSGGKTYLEVIPGIHPVMKGGVNLMYVNCSMEARVTSVAYRRLMDIDQWSVKFFVNPHVRSYGSLLQVLRNRGLIAESDIVTFFFFELIAKEEEEEDNEVKEEENKVEEADKDVLVTSEDTGVTVDKPDGGQEVRKYKGKKRGRKPKRKPDNLHQ